MFHRRTVISLTLFHNDEGEIQDLEVPMAEILAYLDDHYHIVGYESSRQTTTIHEDEAYSSAR